MTTNLSNRILLVLEQIKREATLEFSRSSGRGGQNVNKVESRVTLRWPLALSTLEMGVIELIKREVRFLLNARDELVISSERFRDQIRNRADVLEKIYEHLQRALAPRKKRKATKPTKAAKRKRLEHKRQHKEKKDTRRRVRY